MNRQFLRYAVLAMTAVSLGACGAAKTPEIFKEEFWASSPLTTNTEAELGLAELGMGNYAAAETRFQKALKSDPKDIHALLGMGILFQNTGQQVKAREMYEAILALRPDASQQFVVWNTNNTRPISEIASVNLALLDSGSVVAGMERGAAGQKGGGAVAGAPMAASASAALMRSQRSESDSALRSGSIAGAPRPRKATKAWQAP